MRQEQDAPPVIARSPATAAVRVYPRRGLIIAFGLLLAAFALPLYRLFRFAAASELYSHILLVPVISAYFGWLQWKNLPPRTGPAWIAVLLGLGGSIVTLGAHALLVGSGRELGAEDSLVLPTLSFLLLLTAVCGWFFGPAGLRIVRFPLAFLAFMVPLPVFVQQAVDQLLQAGSVTVAQGLFVLSGMPVFREEHYLQLPGFSMEVAPQCSGIHSTLVLFITSILAAHVFLQPRWKQAVLIAAVLPLALLRNGLRVFVIGQLCVRLGPQMIHSSIHEHGGPLFFALALVPFFALFLALRQGFPRHAKVHPIAA